MNEEDSCAKKNNSTLNFSSPTANPFFAGNLITSAPSCIIKFCRLFLLSLSLSLSSPSSPLPPALGTKGRKRGLAGEEEEEQKCTKRKKTVRVKNTSEDFFHGILPSCAPAHPSHHSTPPVFELGKSGGGLPTTF